jgi:ABC-type transport system involved in cytochrome c biogenesis permease subunit
LTIGVIVVPAALIEVAAALGLIAGIITALGVIAKSEVIGRPVRYAWSHLVAQPVSLWFRSEITAVVVPEVERVVAAALKEQMTPNGGSSIKDAFNRIEGKLDGTHE